MKFCPFRLANIYNIMDYGGDGGGVNDNVAAIMNLIVDLNALGGGTIFFPPGTYKLIANQTSITGAPGVIPGSSHHIRLYDNIFIRGAGIGQTVFDCDTDNSSGFGSYLARNVGIYQCDITGITGAADATKFIATSKVRIDHVYAYGNAYSGIGVLTCNDVIISDCVAVGGAGTNIGFFAGENMGDAKTPDDTWGEDILIVDCEASAFAQRGFGAYGYDVFMSEPDYTVRDVDTVTFLRCNAHENNNAFYHGLATNLVMTDCIANASTTTNVKLLGVHTATITNTDYTNPGGTAAVVTMGDPNYGDCSDITETGAH